MMDAQALEGGFETPAIDAAQAFRAIMRAMARPGDILAVSGTEPPRPLSQAAGVLIATLCDPETPIFLAPSIDVQSVRDWITFHTGAPLTGPETAQFAIGRWTELPHKAFPVGTSEYPDRSTTLIVETDLLAPEGATLKGPGIKTTSQLNLPELTFFQENAMQFPLGLDFFFTHGNRLAGLPRTTKVS